ncbi:MAG: Holliday junction resolvase RuvX, partial [Oscillospiraceae bacterium]|nr:Holliday junction resolvase RuvX [Oscillospiraceae bacterium]
ASPVGVIFESYEPRLLDKLCEIAKEQKAERIVVGLPRNMDGSYGERAEKCSLFSEKLSERTATETVLWDERLTTVSAHKALNEVNVRGKKRKNIVDAVAAVMILEDYMASRKE